ncbi:hypothetical protein Cgig2_017117 [Carnegiea gigantea]|uniref:Uncharacterized protein n=1 Tax=Carnegiea gigantea TaxID=171969 RepID=A0A9Q1QBA6_9CARY|nr:hypothetical protein Cgig2_017117 [Carnegiea gigantea]
MEAANSTRSFPHFDYVPTNGCEPSHRQEQAPSPRYTEREREGISPAPKTATHDHTPEAAECRKILRNDSVSLESSAQKRATGSFIDIITWDCLRKLTHPGRDIVPLVQPILGFGSQEVYPTSMIHLPVRFGDKIKAKNLEPADLLDTVFPPPVDTRCQLPLVQGWHPRSQRPLASRLLALHETKKKSGHNQMKRPINIGAASLMGNSFKPRCHLVSTN